MTVPFAITRDVPPPVDDLDAFGIPGDAVVLGEQPLPRQHSPGKGKFKLVPFAQITVDTS